MSFFDKLRKSVGNIETEVKKLKDMSEDGEQLTEEQLIENLMKAKRFDSDVRQTYSEMTQLLNVLKSSGNLLYDSKQTIDSIKQKLCDIENNSGLKKFGYKPFTEQYAIDSIDDNVFFNDITEEPEVYRPVVDHQKNCVNTENIRVFAEEFTQKTNLSDERTTQTVRFASDMPIVGKRVVSNERIKVDTKPVENNKPFVNKKYEKLLTRTPQPQDFGISRRYTLLPQKYNNNNKVEAKNTPEEPFELSQTCRFNYMNNGFHLGSTLQPYTPPNSNSNSNADSFVTVEFTPGLTTKRPKGISRVNPNNYYNNNNNNNKTSTEFKSNDYKPKEESIRSQRLPHSILQSVENDRITPEQPIPTTDNTKSVHILRSIAVKGSGTPPLPKSRVDANFHNQILKHL